MSTLQIDTISNRLGTKSVPTATVVDGSAKAWVNFNGTGTVAIRAAFNVSSITDNGTGIYTVNFTSPMPDGNYSAIFTPRLNLVAGAGVSTWGHVGLVLAAGSYQLSTFSYVGNTNTLSTADIDSISVAIFR